MLDADSWNRVRKPIEMRSFMRRVNPPPPQLGASDGEESVRDQRHYRLEKGG